MPREATESTAVWLVVMPDTTMAVRFPEMTIENGAGRTTQENRESAGLSGSVPSMEQSTAAAIRA